MAGNTFLGGFTDGGTIPKSHPREKENQPECQPKDFHEIPSLMPGACRTME
jgi:hypothetical protein